jgi:cephalosporin hydroxylase
VRAARDLLNPPAAVRERRARATVDRFHRLYYGHWGRTWRNTYWLGVPLQKCPLDLWVYQELLTEVQPELVVETGTYAGGTALYLASCLDMIGKGRVITIDILEREGRPDHERIEYITGSSTDSAVVERIRVEARGMSPVMVILDSDHSREHVLDELRAYAPVVTPGSYLVVEDTNINGRPVERMSGPGPHEAVEAFLREDRSFTRDPTREKFFLTFNPGGFLRCLDQQG